ncbi:MAG: hypothetical protein ACD_3C00174G0001 [uncultured bacterium (gcode 4)]|uniref:Phage holin family protein n=1 Tax=uncultured bacterium (gcode 4) TaxID=1234023 RepID=K2GBX0_9BACT|nr:MAG: hypothetical protein ACD_3C00174G0001 [uncultured bacterium (gcode 4)]
MKIFFSILFNALILYAIAFFMPGIYDDKNMLISWVAAVWGIKLYFIGWVILGLLNFVVKPLLKILWLPFIILTFWLFMLVINWIILYLLQKIIAGLSIPDVTFEIKWILNFIIAVAIFTVFNIIYNTFLKK